MLYETERTIVRRVTMKDVADFFELDSNPNVHKFLGNKPISTMDQAHKTVEHILAHYRTTNMGRLAIIEKSSGEFIGWTGIKYEAFILPRQYYYDLGYRLKEKFWGKGFATETARASMQYGFEHLHLTTIGAAAEKEHHASINVFKKLGMHFIKDFEFEGKPCVYYEKDA